MTKQAKFQIGDAVHINFNQGDEQVVSADKFVITEINEILTQRGREFVYNLETPDGRLIKGFLESRLSYSAHGKQDETESVCSGKRLEIGMNYTSDELLDEYNYQTMMHALTHLDEFKEAADLARDEWDRLYGKEKQTGAV